MPGCPGAFRRAERSLISASMADRCCCSFVSSALAASMFFVLWMC